MSAHEPALAVRDASFSYGRGNGPPVVDGLDCTFDPAALTAITGPSGSGKSTVLYLCGLLLRPSSGDIVVDGSLTAALPERLRAGIRRRVMAYVFQDALLDASRTVFENAAEAARLAGVDSRSIRSDAIAMLERLEVEVPLDRRPSAISGGQAQRVGVCRALLKRPGVVLADEPTGNLDARTTELVIDTLREFAAHTGATVVIATHDPIVVAAADAVHDLAVSMAS